MTKCKFGYAEIEVDTMAGKDGREVLHYRHPISGKWVESIEVVLEDMNKYYDRKKEEMRKLVESIKKDTDILEDIKDKVREKDYS